MKFLREIVRILLGATFVFSGFVKAIDPLGSTYKFSDYFTAFGMEWATVFSLALSIILSLSEFGIGVALLLNYRTKIFSWFSLIFMTFFLFLTLYIAIKNPVTDCGCFGDALVLSNWATFYKNIFFTSFAIIVFLNRDKYQNRIKIKTQNAYFAFIMGAMLSLQINCYNHLPIIDFRPYKIGNNIIEGMETPPGAPSDVYRNEFVYKEKSTGRTEKFDDTNYPWKDSLNWEFVEMNSILVKKGYHPPIHDFTIESSDGEDYSDYFLNEKKNTFVLIAYNLDKSSKKNQEKINELAREVLNKGDNFICLTSSTSEEIIEFETNYNPPYQFYLCDEITLKTIIRSNPGLMLIREGTVIDKWHWRDIPKIGEAKK